MDACYGVRSSVTGGRTCSSCSSGVPASWRGWRTRSTESGVSATRHVLRSARRETTRREQDARTAAARIVADAEDEALRIRQAIGTRVADATARLDELLSVRESLLEDLRTLVASYEQMVARLDHSRPQATGR